MVTLINPTKRDALDYRGLSTDEKPTDTANGATFIEIDTGDIYMFDETSGQWYKI